MCFSNLDNIFPTLILGTVFCNNFTHARVLYNVQYFILLSAMAPTKEIFFVAKFKCGRLPNQERKFHTNQTYQRRLVVLQWSFVIKL